MNTEATTSIQLGSLLAPVSSAALPAVIDQRTLTPSIARSFELGLALGRRFEIVLTGKGRRVDDLPSVALARTVRVGDGTLEGSLGNMAKRALLFATPASIALATAFGAAEVSDLALVIAAVAPFTWVPAAAVRSVRAERAAKRDIAFAASTQAAPDDLMAINTFIRAADLDDPRVAAMARTVIEAWIETARQDNSITTSAETQLVALRDELAAPTTDVADQTRRLLALGGLARTLAREPSIARSHVDILRQAMDALAAIEREAVAPALRQMFANPAHERLRALLPEVSVAPRPREPMVVKILGGGSPS